MMNRYICIPLCLFLLSVCNPKKNERPNGWYYITDRVEDSISSEPIVAVNDFEEIRDWAAFHHEKLNGKGYPFGKTADELNEQERMMACVDIYQALTEDRPYKKGLSHEKTCDILDDMAHKGFIDSDISKTIRECFGRT